jgi:organic radical activating enzyme
VDPLSGQFDWITLSPKRHRPPRPELLAACHELKLVVHCGDDLSFAAAMAAAARRQRRADSQGRDQGSDQSVDQEPVRRPVLLLQPGADCAAGQQLAIDYVKANPDWRLSLQSHKLLGLR